MRLRVNSSRFCHFDFLYAIALVNCTRGVSQTIQHHMISKKYKNIARIDHAWQPLFTSQKVFNTTLLAKPFSHWPKSPLSPLRSSLRGKNTNTRPSEIPPKGKKTPFNPDIPPFEGPGLFGLPSVSGSSTPTCKTSPTKYQRSDTLSPSLSHWERLGKDP